MRLPRRPSSTSSASDAGDRIASLLASPTGGWLPPEPEPERGPWQPREQDQSLWDATADLSTADLSTADLSTADLSTADQVGRLSALLPLSVRQGRVDPGRRGAAALVAITLLAALVAGGVVLRGRPEQVAVPEVVDRGRPAATSGPGGPTRSGGAAGGAAGGAPELVVAVAGQVVRPGVVRVPAGSRVGDAVEAAGGALPGASTGLLNLARKVVDGEQVLVGVDPPSAAAGPMGPAARGGPAARAGAGGLLNLNTASASDLDALPGIGPVLAQRIVDWRVVNDRFGSVEQLREVTGIGEAKFQDLKAKVTV